MHRGAQRTAVHGVTELDVTEHAHTDLMISLKHNVYDPVMCDVTRT